jgi:hypothetical protein
MVEGEGMIDRVAYEVLIGDFRSFTFAKSIAQAKWNAVSSAREAGYFLNRWPSPLAAKRASRFDDSPLKNKNLRACYDPDQMY